MADERTPLIAGNWKMHKTIAQAEEYIAGPAAAGLGVRGGDRDLRAVHRAAGDGGLDARLRRAVYAQNMHEAPEGAFTGEISAPMLNELDVHGVVLGHSERRQYFGETDRALQAKVPAALDGRARAAAVRRRDRGRARRGARPTASCAIRCRRGSRRSRPRAWATL